MSSTLALSGVKENVFPITCGNVVENFIFNDIILFYFIYFIIPMMFWLDMLLRSYVGIVPYYVLAGGTANFIICFDNYVIATDVIVTRPDVFEAHFIYYVIMVHDVIEPYGCQG